MFRNSIIALSAATLLGAGALAPAEALAHGSGGGGSHNVTAYRPIVNPVVSAGLGLGLGSGSKIGSGAHPIPHPIPFPCKFCGGIGGTTTTGTTTTTTGTTTTTTNPGHGGFTASFGGGDYGAYSADSCQVVRKRTPSGQIMEVCDNWLGQ